MGYVGIEDRGLRFESLESCVMNEILISVRFAMLTDLNSSAWI